MERAADVFETTPEGFALRDVVVRLARPDEVCRWNRVVDRHHDLGFHQFAGRGLRSVFTWRGQWMGAAGGQTGAFRGAPRDRGMGGRREEPLERLHRIGNPTRFVILGGRRAFRGLASCAWSRMERRLSDDGEAAYGTPLRVAESWGSPTKFRGTPVPGGERDVRGQEQGRCVRPRARSRSARGGEGSVRGSAASRRRSSGAGSCAASCGVGVAGDAERPVGAGVALDVPAWCGAFRHPARGRGARTASLRCGPCGCGRGERIGTARWRRHAPRRR